jgi:hypothetical protein
MRILEVSVGAGSSHELVIELVAPVLVATRG